MYSLRDIVNKFKKIRKQIEFAGYCMPKGDDEWFTAQVKKLGKEKNVVNLVRQGEQEIQVLYHIYIPASYSGFFSNYNRVLSYLYFADQYHLTPVVEYSRENTYAEKHPVNGSENPYEYYFCQPAGISLDKMRNNAVVLESRRENSWLANELDEKAVNYMRSDLFIREMGKLVKKYIRLRPQVAECLNAQKERLLNGKKTLGVHVRGTDFKWNYNGHPVCVTSEEYLKKALELVEKGGYTQVFLATDDLDAVDKFRMEFGERLVYYNDVIRSNGNVTVMKSKSERTEHHYLLGLEVLRDMLTLADCDGLLAGLSQVSYAVRFQKESYGKQFEDMVILNKGINEHTKYNCPK